jgi:hypothetical protein
MGENDDRADIMNTFAAYSIAIDQSDWSLMGRAYDSESTHINAEGAEVHGLDAFVAYRTRKEPHEHKDILHIPFNVLLEVNGDRAKSISNFLYLGRSEGSPTWEILSAGMWQDDLRRVDDGWRFATRRIHSFRYVTPRKPEEWRG